MRSSADFKSLKEIPEEYFEHLEENTPEYLLTLLGKIVAVFLYRLNVPREEVEQFTDRIERREFDMLFDSFEAYDVQETRRVSRAVGREEGRAEGKLVGTADAVLELLKDVGPVPEELKKSVLAVTDLEQLKAWLKLAAKAESIEQFCRQAGI